MMTTEPVTTKHWHAQSAEQVCADLDPGGFAGEYVIRAADGAPPHRGHRTVRDRQGQGSGFVHVVKR